jgi:molecular chaperone GrpE
MIDEQNNKEESVPVSSEPMTSDRTEDSPSEQPLGTATTQSPENRESESVSPSTPEATEEESPSFFDELELESEPGVDITASLSAEIESLQQKVESLQAQLDQEKEQYKRMAADFENFRKRTERDKEDLSQQVRSSTILELLPVLDTFSRAKEQLKPESEEAQKVHSSYQGVFKQFLDCLKRISVTPMNCEGQEFDPAFHNAIMREPTDQYPEGTIIQEFQSGYMVGDKVLRHAMVKVAVALDPSSESAEQD